MKTEKNKRKKERLMPKRKIKELDSFFRTEIPYTDGSIIDHLPSEIRNEMIHRSIINSYNG